MCLRQRLKLFDINGTRSVPSCNVKSRTNYIGAARYSS